eukprot:gene14288-30397_t
MYGVFSYNGLDNNTSTYTPSPKKGRTSSYPFQGIATDANRTPFITTRASTRLLLSKRFSVRMSSTTYDCDFIVIGGGSGGLSASKQAASLGARTVLFDFVKPSTQGTTWGLGGTCVNVGCVPKKLMHYGGILGHSFHDAEALGWQLKKDSHNWTEMLTTVNNHVRKLNFQYRVGLKNKDVTYINGLARFVDAHTVEYITKSGKDTVTKTMTAANILIAVGGRPVVPADIPGAVEHAITSDDIFFKKQSPGKTLCVGGSYIALECAGFLTGLGYDVTVAVRSILLRGFDRQCAEKIGSLMVDVGTKMLHETVPISITKLPNGELEVVLRHSSGAEKIETFNTVLFATGRTADLAGLNLAAAGVEVNRQGKIEVNNECTNVPHIYAVGDICAGKPELTPVAVRAGELLAKRIFGGASQRMNYDMVATTVFTPYEYGCVGLSEEDAIDRYGEDDIEVYLSEFSTLEFSAVHRLKHPIHGEDVEMGACCMSKLICVKSQKERVVGFHFIGPNAGEMTQGFALALKLGATKEDFDELVGIHPTDAESFCSLVTSKRSGINWVAAGGCGGGVCG